MERTVGFSTEVFTNVAASLSQENRRKRAFSRETDQELVNQVLLRRFRPLYTVNDLFRLFGRFHRYFRIVIMITMLIGIPYIFEYEFQKMYKMRPPIFYDCIAQGYNPKRIITQKKTDSHEFTIMRRLGPVIAPIICIIFYRLPLKTAIQIFVSLGILRRLLVITPLHSLSRLTQGFLKSMGTILSVRYLLSSMPHQLIVFGIATLIISSETIAMGASVLSEIVLDPSYDKWISTIPFVLAGAVIFLAAPHSLLSTVVERKGQMLGDVLKKYTGREKIDVDALIDDIMFAKGTALEYGLSSCFKMYFVKSYIVKQITFIGIHLLVDGLGRVVVLISIPFITMDFRSSQLFTFCGWVTAALLSIIILSRLTARFVLFLALVCLATGILLCQLHHYGKGINICSDILDRPPNEDQYLTTVIGVFLIIQARVLCSAGVMELLATNLPVEHQSVLVPMHYLGRNALFFIVELIAELFELKTFITLKIEISVIGIVVGILIMFLQDGKRKIIVSSGEDASNSRTPFQYSFWPEMDDDSYLDATTSTETSSLTSGRKLHPFSAVSDFIKSFKKKKNKRKNSDIVIVPDPQYLETPITATSLENMDEKEPKALEPTQPSDPPPVQEAPERSAFSIPTAKTPAHNSAKVNATKELRTAASDPSTDTTSVLTARPVRSHWKSEAPRSPSIED